MRKLLNFHLPIFLSVCLIATASFFWYAQKAQATAVAFVNTGTATENTSSPATNSFTCTAAANEVGVAYITYDANSTLSITSVTYGGVAMNQVGTPAVGVSGTIHNYTAMYTLTAGQGLKTGANSLVATVSGTVSDIYEGFTCFSGADQTNPVRTGSYQTQVSTTSSVSIIIPSSTSDITTSEEIDGPNAGGNTTNQTRDQINTTGNISSISTDHVITPAASVTHTWTVGSGNIDSIAGFSIQPPQAAAAVSKNPVIINGTGKVQIINGKGTVQIYNYLPPIIKPSYT